MLIINDITEIIVQKMLSVCKQGFALTIPHELESEAGFRWTCALNARVECLRISSCRVIVTVGTC